MGLIAWFKDGIKMLFKYIKILFIHLRHGINPFLPVFKNIEKASERLSENEKNFCINACKSECMKNYLRKAFYKSNIVDNVERIDLWDCGGKYGKINRKSVRIYTVDRLRK